MGPGLAYSALVLISVLLTLQSSYTLYLMLWTWDRPESEEAARAPERFSPPRFSFTVMLPARHEEAVIQTTITRVVRADYPPELLQVLVVCAADDTGTIARAEEEIRTLESEGFRNASLIVFHDKPINKPHGLNAALPHAANDIVTVFDAEDDIHPQIFNVVNSVMAQEDVRVVQAGVQLMNFASNWYSTLNVLEYFFWFKSRLHYHARHGAIPLGGNTVFFERRLLESVGGWDDSNLTEDAEIGLRLSAMGEPIRVVYDDRYVTKEETPPTLAAFIRQRTRWCQGFMQTLRRGSLKQLPSRKQRWLAFYTLAFSRVQAILGIYFLCSLVMTFAFTTPMLIALVAYLPVLMLGALFLISVVGLYEFTDAHGLKASPGTVARMAVAWFPYQLVLAYAAMRALWRQLAGGNDWEKTEHVGAHRALASGGSSHAS
jgi:cellulose synthase/poly-beta-1,6-N-acetylglucosamine synthase-like glycosyltransferase